MFRRSKARPFVVLATISVALSLLGQDASAQERPAREDRTADARSQGSRSEETGPRATSSHDRARTDRVDRDRTRDREERPPLIDLPGFTVEDGGRRGSRGRFGAVDLPGFDVEEGTRRGSRSRFGDVDLPAIDFGDAISGRQVRGSDASTLGIFDGLFDPSRDRDRDRRFRRDRDRTRECDPILDLPGLDLGCERFRLRR